MEYFIKVRLKNTGDRERIVQFLRDMDADIVEASRYDLEAKPKSKYPFDTVKIGFGFDIPEGTSIQTMRVTVSKWHSDNKQSGKRFKVFSDIRAVVRIK